jgi:redox-sensitive bicupin YhaK (pirin superfamily)
MEEQANGSSALETIVVTRERELVNDFKVRRVLPSARRRMVGPFVFSRSDGTGVVCAPDEVLDVAPHPHIGLATVTYLFAGELLHRDGLGTVERIRPEEVNWMTGRKRAAHSERTPPESRTNDNELFGLQSWVALPLRYEETTPEFTHYGAGQLPLLEAEGKRVRRYHRNTLWRAFTSADTIGYVLCRRHT